MRNALIKLAIALGLSLFLTWIYLSTSQNYFSLDQKLRDYMFVIRGTLPKSNTVIIVDIDNKSLKEVGQWPWSRNTMAKLISNLTQAKPGIIGLDMVFAEEDKSSPHLLKKKFPTITQTLPNYDIELANVFSASPVVGGYVFTDENTLETRTPLIPAIFIEKGLKDSHYLNNSKGIVLNTPTLQNALYSSGFFLISDNEGGVVRSVPLILKYKDIIYPSLAFEMLRIYSQSKKVEVIGDKEGIKYIHFGKYKIPTEISGEFIVNFRGPAKHFKYISASDILNNTFNPTDIENKFILIGTSAPGLKDLRYIAYDSTFPGVEVHANVIDNILKGDYIQKPFIIKLVDIAVIWILVFSLMLIFNFITSWLIIPIAISLFFLMLYSLYNILFDYGYVLTIITPILAFGTTLTVSTVLDYFFASKQREQARRVLGQKVSDSVMEQLLSHNHNGLIESKEVITTIFFSDIRGFTSISESIGSPKKLIELLNTYMTPMTNIIMKKQGTIDKFIGDAIMAYWNAPMPVENHADLAVSSAIEQVERLTKVNEILLEKYNISIQIGIGLHTGLVTAGEMGSEGRSDYTIIGDNVNLASRIEALTRIYDVEILISEETYSQLIAPYSIRLIDIVEVKGKKNAVKIYEVLTNNTPLSDEEIKLHKQALKLYQEHYISNAHILFRKLNKEYPSTLYAHFIQRCETYINNPSKNFTPILKMMSK